MAIVSVDNLTPEQRAVREENIRRAEAMEDPHVIEVGNPYADGVEKPVVPLRISNEPLDIEESQPIQPVEAEKGVYKDYKFENDEQMALAILNFKDRREWVEIVPEWGDMAILFRELDAAENTAVKQRNVNIQTRTMNMEGMYIDTIMIAAFNPTTKKKLFKAHHKELLKQKNGAVIERLALKVLGMSGASQQGFTFAKNS